MELDGFSYIAEQYQGIVVACSGGSDSMALLELIYQNSKQKKKINLVNFHVNFGLRENESLGDERFVKRETIKRNIKFISYKVTQEDEKLKKGRSVQEWARLIRYREFEKFIQEGHIIAMAHHKNDLIENIFLRMLRGSFPDRWAGMKTHDAKKKIWRPLLNYSKEEILQYVKNKKIKFRLDSSNLDTKYTRNKLRIDIFPQLEKMFPGVGERLIASTKMVEEVFSYEREKVTIAFEKNITLKNATKMGINYEFFREASHSQKCFILEKLCQFVQEKNISLNYDLLIEKLSLENNTSRKKFSIEIPGGGKIFVIKNNLVVEKASLFYKPERFFQFQKQFESNEGSVRLEHGVKVVFL